MLEAISFEKTDHCINVLDMNEAQTEALRHNLEAHHGRGVVMVHHDFHRKGNSFMGIDGFTPRPEYIFRVNTFLQSCIAHSIPLILFQEHHKLNELAPLLQFTHTALHVVPTYVEHPYPNKSHIRKDDLTQEDWYDWQNLFEVLEEVGLRKALIGGCVLRHRDATNQHLKIIDGEKMSSKDCSYLLKEKVSEWEEKSGKNSLFRKFTDQGFVPDGCPGAVMIGFAKRGIEVVPLEIYDTDEKVRHKVLPRR